MAFLSRLRIFGTNKQGSSAEVPIENNGSLPVEISQRSAFNEVATAEKTAELQYTFPYQVLNTDIIDSSVTGGGGVSVSGAGQGLRLRTTTTSSSTAQAKSVRTIKYRSGQGIEGVFAGRFVVTPNSDSFAYIGIGNDDDGFYFAYDGFSGNSEFNIVHFRGGSPVSYIPQSSWNVDKMDGAGVSGQTLDVTKGNVYKIEFQFLGYGAINFFIEDNNTGKFQLVHTIKYANLNNLTSLNNSSVGLVGNISNGTSSNDDIIYITSIGLFVQGKIRRGGSSITNSHDVSGVNSTLLNGHLMTIRSRSTYGGVDNYVRAFATAISLVNDATSNEIVYLIEDGTFTSVSYTNINTNNSTLEVDVAGTYTLGTGKVLTGWGVPKSGGSVNEIIKDLEYYISAGKTFSLVTGANSNNMTAIFTLSEDF